MATSGSVDFGTALTRDNIIQQALEDLEIMAAGDTVASSSFADNSAGAAIKLNAIVKLWGHSTDGSLGIQAWAIKRAYLFLQKGQAVYTLGPTSTATGSTNKWASAYVTTTLGADELAAQTILTMTDGSIFSPTDRIGIVLGTGYLHWTTVVSVAGNDVTVTHALPSDLSAGARVFAYATTAQGRRPLDIKTAVIRDLDGNDTPMNHRMDLDDYELGVTTKTVMSMPLAFYYEGTLVDGTIYFNCAADDVSHVVRIAYRSPFEDFDAAGDTMDFDPMWAKALIYQLAFELCPRFGKDKRMPTFKVLRDEALSIARNANPETCNDYFCPGEAG